jgi:hypothetical protein
MTMTHWLLPSSIAWQHGHQVGQKYLISMKKLMPFCRHQNGGKKGFSTKIGGDDRMSLVFPVFHSLLAVLVTQGLIKVAFCHVFLNLWEQCCIQG